jgi:hypothetical protein
MRLSIAASLALTITLAACGNEGAKAPGGVSEGEAKALEEAASMLDERRLPPEALPPEAQSADLTGDTAAPDSE